MSRISKKQKENSCKALFLDLSIEAHDGEFTTKLFDKRDVFLFYVNHMRLKTLDSKCTRINLFLEKIFGQHVFHKFEAIADEFIKLYSL